MAYNWKVVWFVLVIVLGAFIIVFLHRQQYFTTATVQIPSLEKSQPSSTQSERQQQNLLHLQETSRLRSQLTLRDKEIQEKTREIQDRNLEIIRKDGEIKSLKASVKRLQAENDELYDSQQDAAPSNPQVAASRPQVAAPSTSASLYDCRKGMVLPPKSSLSAMSVQQLAKLYHSYVENIQVLCGHMVRMGAQGDGGWEVCDDDILKPRKPCLVYSVGINNDFTFDDQVGRYYGCEIHAFDPSMNKPDHKRSDFVMFHNLGFADYDGRSPNNWKMGTLNTIRRDLGHSKKQIDILKIDIEEWEMKVFPQMIKTNALRNITQFVFEMHISLVKADGSKERYQTALEILRDLYDLGFRIFFTHRNRFSYFMSRMANAERTACHEINMVKVC